MVDVGETDLMKQFPYVAKSSASEFYKWKSSGQYTIPSKIQKRFETEVQPVNAIDMSNPTFPLIDLHSDEFNDLGNIPMI